MSRSAMLTLAVDSAWNRRVVLSLVVACFALSTFLLLTLERVRIDVRDSFSSAVSGTDLIVGARTGPIQLLLYSVFRLGGASNNIRWSSVQAVAQHPSVAWVVPLSLGDSHRGFPVVATTNDYFDRFRYGSGRPLEMARGADVVDLFDAVIGSEVARRLGYALGQPIVLSHGDGTFVANDHEDLPFTVVGVLASTGTPVDRSIHISLEGMEAIHHGWMGGVPIPAKIADPGGIGDRELTPSSVTAALVGLKSRTAVFSVQRFVGDFQREPLMAILPGVALSELWDVVGLGEGALRSMAALIALVSVAGLAAVSLAGLEQRRRELAILRAVGLGPIRIVQLLLWEGALVTIVGITVGYVLHVACIILATGWAQSHLGVSLSLGGLGANEMIVLGAILLTGMIATLFPALRAYRISLVDGLSPRD